MKKLLLILTIAVVFVSCNSYYTDEQGVTYLCHSGSEFVSVVGYNENDYRREIVIPEKICVSSWGRKRELTVNHISGTDGGFRNCVFLKKIYIKSSLKKIWFHSFECRSLEAVVIASVDEIEPYSFEHCNSLKSVTILNETPPILGDYAFDIGSNQDLMIYVPTVDIVKAYRENPKYNNLKIQALKFNKLENN